MSGHYHWHISYCVPAGYRVLDTIPFASRQACHTMIQHLAWAKDEQPEPRRVAARFCLADSASPKTWVRDRRKAVRP